MGVNPPNHYHLCFSSWGSVQSYCMATGGTIWNMWNISFKWYQSSWAELSIDVEPKSAAIQICFYNNFGKDVGVLAGYHLLWQIAWQQCITYSFIFNLIQVNGETRDLTETLILFWFHHYSTTPKIYGILIAWPALQFPTNQEGSKRDQRCRPSNKLSIKWCKCLWTRFT